MKIVLNRESILPVLTTVGGVVERRQTLPILGNVLINASDNSVVLTGTDLEVEVECSTQGDVQEPGQVTVPMRKFSDICRALPAGSSLTLAVDKEKARLLSGKGRFVLSTLASSDFPTMKAGEQEASFSIEQAALKKLLDQTAFAMANQDVRYYLNGALWEIMEGTLTSVATDGHRLAKASVAIEHEGSAELRVILPGKTVLELRRLMSAETEAVKVELSAKSVQATAGMTRILSKLIDGRYPDYQKVMPQSTEHRAVIDRDSLRHAIQRTAILSNDKYKGVRFVFDAGLLRLQAQNPEQEEAEEELEIEYEDGEVSVGFNVAYVLDVLGAIESQRVVIDLAGGGKSSIWRGQDSEGAEFVIMPMRL